jgi:uncharacterized membrane protein
MAADSLQQTLDMPREWLLKRNCALTPRQVARAYALLCLLSLAVASMFVWQGAWYVLAFTVLELGAVALAFLHYARHATDHEHIALVDGGLLVERVSAGQVEQEVLNPSWTRVLAPIRTQDLICLVNHGTRIEVGRHVTCARRRQIAQELKRALPGGAV